MDRTHSPGDTDAEAAAHAAFAALVACLGLDEERGLRYADVVRTLLSSAARTALEAIMESPQHREFQSEFARKYTALGKAEGKAEDVLRILERRGIAVTEAQRETLLHTMDVETLDLWLDRAIVSASADEVFS